MKSYLKYLKVDLIIIAALVVLIAAWTGMKRGIASAAGVERANTLCTTEERVFDYADKLSDRQEDKLRKLIAKREAQIQADIIIVTMEEDISDYEVMVYSDDLQDSEAFGYNEPYGNCAMLVDNWATGYMWFHTAGNVMEQYDSDDKINFLLDKTCEFVNASPYRGYRAYVDALTTGMQGTGFFTLHVSYLAIGLAALAATALFLWINLYRKGAEKTTTASTYMKDQSFQVIRKEDTFLTKNVTKRRIETNSGGGSKGGGGHISGGGHSYGGGGRHH